MTNLLLKNAEVVFPNHSEQTNVLIENGKIKSISNEIVNAEKVLELEGKKLLAGFIDIHNHGAVGFDVNEASKDDLIEVSKFLAKKGITAWLPTLVPDSDENYQKATESIDGLMNIQSELPIAQVLGVHYEGVFANEKMCGALRPEYFKNFKNGNEISQLPRLKKGIHFTTLAPEVENGIELIKELTRQNWIVSIGHTKANTEVLDKAFRNGAKHLTHFFNAMTGLHHRDLGVVGWALTNNGVTFDIIADGVHVHPMMVRFAIKTKSVDKVSLISDSVLPTGLGDGEFEIWGEKITVVNGKTQNETGSIAGSVITMEDAFKKLDNLGFSNSEISKMASINPAKLLGIQNSHGSIEVGKRADLIVMNEQGNIEMILINGKPIY